MKSKIAYIIDTYSHESYHEVINQGLLMMVSEIYDEVVYEAEEKSIENIKFLLKECSFNFENVKFRSLDLKRHHNKFINKGLEYLLLILKVSFLNYKYYMAVPKNCDVYFNNNIHFAAILIQYFSFFKKNKIYDLCHNELEWIDKNKTKSKVELLLGRFYGFIFRKIKLSSKFTFILLSENMASYFKKEFVSKQNADRVSWIDHCYIRPTINEEFNKNNGTLIKIGLPGAINAQRGLSYLKYLLSNINNDNIKIYSLSTISENIKNTHLVIINKTSHVLPFNEYSKKIREMDALAFFYSTDSYKLTASGAVLEAIWNGKPILALKNNYFEYLFNKYGQLGVLCDNIEELSNRVNNISCDELDSYYCNIKRAKQELLPVNVKKQLIRLL